MTHGVTGVHHTLTQDIGQHTITRPEVMHTLWFEFSGGSVNPVNFNGHTQAFRWDYHSGIYERFGQARGDGSDSVIYPLRQISFKLRPN